MREGRCISLIERLKQGSELKSTRYSSCCSCSSCAFSRWGDALKKRLRLGRFKSDRGLGVKFGVIAVQVNRHRLKGSDFLYDVILSRWRL